MRGFFWVPANMTSQNDAIWDRTYFKWGRQRSGIHTLKYHNWPRVPYGNVTKPQENITYMYKRAKRSVRPFPANMTSQNDAFWDGIYLKISLVRKKATIRTLYTQIPHLTKLIFLLAQKLLLAQKFPPAITLLLALKLLLAQKLALAQKCWWHKYSCKHKKCRWHNNCCKHKKCC